jgi:hypothetical protein
VVALVLGAALAHPPAAPKWTVRQAQAVLSAHPYRVIDESQPDEPDYVLSFTRPDARRLRRTSARTFAYAGPAHDVQTDTTPTVRFTLTRRGRLVDFRGPPADTSQPAFPIRASFYYAWYPEVSTP